MAATPRRLLAVDLCGQSCTRSSLNNPAPPSKQGDHRFHGEIPRTRSRRGNESAACACCSRGQLGRLAELVLGAVLLVAPSGQH